MGRTNNIMKFKITGDINISGATKGDIIDVELHAMETYIKNGTVELFKTVAKKK
jgi:acetamidase/formamidase